MSSRAAEGAAAADAAEGAAAADDAAPGRAPSPDPTPGPAPGETSLAAVVGTLTRALRADGPHRPPGPDDLGALARLVGAVLAALEAGAGPPAVLTDAAGALGFAVRCAGGRTVLVADPRSERSWGLVALPVGPGPPDVVVEVPHPQSDLRTEEVGTALAERLDRAVLLVAGAHRRAGAAPGARRRRDFPADVAHRPDAVFSRVATGVVVAHGVPQVQVHGCADRDGFDVVASAGAAGDSPLLDSVVDGLRAAGERVRRGGEPGCEDLSGTRNVQGRVAARCGAPFVHLELSRSVRRDADRRAAVVAAVTDAVVGTR